MAEEKNSSMCSCMWCSWCQATEHHHHVVLWIARIIVVAIVFSLGVMIGEMRGFTHASRHRGGYEAGRMMGGRGYGPEMPVNQAGSTYDYAPVPEGQSTSTPR